MDVCSLNDARKNPSGEGMSDNMIVCPRPATGKDSYHPAGSQFIPSLGDSLTKAP